jgi:hypothetical protein
MRMQSLVAKLVAAAATLLSPIWLCPSFLKVPVSYLDIQRKLMSSRKIVLQGFYFATLPEFPKSRIFVCDVHHANSLVTSEFGE